MTRLEIIFLALTILQSIVQEWIRRRSSARARTEMVKQVVAGMNGNGNGKIGHGG